MNQINPVHTIPSYLSNIYFNIIHPSMSYNWNVNWYKSINKLIN
jgi:hypothetical protein